MIWTAARSLWRGTNMDADFSIITRPGERVTFSASDASSEAPSRAPGCSTRSRWVLYGSRGGAREGSIP